MNSLIGKIGLFILTQAIAVVTLLQTIAIVKAQSITTDGGLGNTGTNVNSNINNPNQLDITGGTTSSDGANLFHSFQNFGLNNNEIANFISNPNIQNILGRVVGGNNSIIDGIIRVTGGNSNLFLMNPAGILFGANSSLNVPADFTATTANSILFGNLRFNAIGNNDYTNLVGTPNGFAFSTTQTGSIVNLGNLAVDAGNNLNIIGGTVVSTGSLSAPGGNIIVTSVPGEKLLRISQPGHLLSLEVEAPSAASPNSASLLDLLTGNINNASGVTINNGNVKLTGSGLTVNSGNVVVKDITSESATLSADQNLTLVPGQLETTDNLNLLAGNTINFGGDITANSTNGNISLSGIVDGDYNLNLNAGTGNLTLNGAVDVNSLTTNAENINIADNITTAGNQQFTGAVNLTGNNTKAFNSTNNNILFSSTINGQDTDFTLNAGNGNLTLNGAVDVKSLTTNAANTNIANNITTAGNQTYNGGVTLTGNNAKTFDSTNNNILFGSTINGNSNLTLNAGTGNITFTNGIGNITALGNILANSTGITKFNSSVTASRLTTNTGGTTEINGNITTNNEQNYNDAVTVANSPTLAGSGITFNETVNGNSNLTANAGTGKVTFEQNVGNSAP
ncbi:MAG: filamentous hemagglutinin N-terminal domain-containing protein, partial [Nostocales cyanobacterium]